MTNATTQTVNLPNLTEQEIYLAEAYAQSARQDKLMASEFEYAIDDGLKGEDAFLSSLDADGNGSEFNNFPKRY